LPLLADFALYLELNFSELKTFTLAMSSIRDEKLANLLLFLAELLLLEPDTLRCELFGKNRGIAEQKWGAKQRIIIKPYLTPHF
jgi:hypothetical protein